MRDYNLLRGLRGFAFRQNLKARCGPATGGSRVYILMCGRKFIAMIGGRDSRDMNDLRFDPETRDMKRMHFFPPFSNGT